jgi:aspartate dehydrogenase
MRVGLIGAGAIGRQIMAALDERRNIETLLFRPGGRGTPGSLLASVTVITAMPEFIAAAPACVIEAARQEAVAEHLPAFLSHGIPAVLCSTGALADLSLRLELIRLAEAHSTQIVIPGGAVAGLDYLRTVSHVPGTEVTYTSRKPPAAWRRELAERGLDGDRLREPAVLFEGTPEDAARRFPRNANSALTIALAAGERAVSVRIVADPAAQGNSQDIEVRGPVGTAHFTLVNAPSPGNPKSSAITALSALQAADGLMLKSGLRFS